MGKDHRGTRGLSSYSVDGTGGLIDGHVHQFIVCSADQELKRGNSRTRSEGDAKRLGKLMRIKRGRERDSRGREGN